MKKIIFFIIAIVILISSGFAQITITKLDGTPINDGDIITFNNVGDDANLTTLITNNAGTAIDLNLVAEDIIGTNGSQMEFCFSSCLWGIVQGTIYGPLSLDAGATTTELQVHFHNHSTENDVITYTFRIYEEGNSSNVVHFTYKYDVNYVGIDDIKSYDISVYPNPTTEYFKIRLPEELEGSNITLTNILGEIILEKEINNSNEKVYVNNLAKGIYFYSIINANKLIETKKLIIK